MRSIGRGMGRQRIGIALIFALVLAGLVTVGHATTAPPDVAVSISGFAFHGPGGARRLHRPGRDARHLDE